MPALTVIGSRSDAPNWTLSSASPGAQPLDRRLEVVDARRRRDDDELIGPEPTDDRRLGDLLPKDPGDIDERPSPAGVAVRRR